MSRVLVIPDLHLPVAHSEALRFCVDIYNQWSCDRVVFIGDVVDHHAISFHSKNPNCPSAAHEYDMVREQLYQWRDTFPVAAVTIGNHDNRPQRVAEDAGMPDVYMRNLKELWETPLWRWDYSIEIDDVYYFHGIGGGKTPALNKANTMGMSVVMGHCHSVFGTHWGAGPKKRWFGCDCGCLIDNEAWQFAYGKHMSKKPILGCAVVIDGTPYLEPMPCGKGEEYHG